MKRQTRAPASLQAPDAASGRLAPPCRTACPADMDIPGFLRAVARGDHSTAWRIIYHDNLFPTVLGWICPRPCEGACRLGSSGAPVPVCQIKRWVTASHAPPTDLIRDRRHAGPPVAIVGAGPAGLAAAHDLALEGVEVTVLDRSEFPGGLLTSCIPDFRLPRWAASGDITRVFSLGIRFEPRFALRSAEQVVSLLDERGFAAVLLATGPGDDREPQVPGWRRSAATWTAIAFLQEAHGGAMRMDGARVVVVGGGNGAIDAARTALRAGASEVRILYRRRRREMPAFPEEIEAAELEGARILPQTVVTEVVWDGDTVRGVRCAHTRAETDDRSAPPVVDAAIGPFVVCDAIVFAIGQTPTVNVDAAAYPNVFSCADSPDDVGTVVTAIASGRRSAARVLEALSRRGLLPSPPIGRAPHDPVEPAVPPAAQVNGDTHGGVTQVNENGIGNPGNTTPPLAGELPLLLPPAIAAGAARRCLGCDSLLVLDPQLCILCGLCAQVCAFDALAWLPGLGNDGPAWRLAINDTDCQRCGDCVAVCPAGAFEWRPWTHPNRSCAVRSILVDAPADDSSNCSDGAG